MDMTALVAVIVFFVGTNAVPTPLRKVSDLDLKDAKRILSRSRTRQGCDIIQSYRHYDLSTAIQYFHYHKFRSLL